MAAARGVCVVTGGALGIESAAIEAALGGGGKCIAALAHGFDVDAYPEANAGLFQRIVESGGAIVSCQPWDRPPLPWMFLARGRIVAGLSSCLALCEAGVPSGTFSAAEAALDAGRLVLAVPGRTDDSASTGCNILIANGARPIVSEATFADMLESLDL